MNVCMIERKEGREREREISFERITDARAYTHRLAHAYAKTG